RWSVSTGSLPAGLNLGPSDGVLSGTPTVSGTFQFTLQITDAAQGVSSKGFTLSIRPVTKLTVIAPNTLHSGLPGVSYSESLRADGRTVPYRWTIASGSLPAGITLDGSTGTLTGLPTTLGTFQFTARVSDAVLAIADRSYTLAILPPPLPTMTFGG